MRMSTAALHLPLCAQRRVLMQITTQSVAHAIMCLVAIAASVSAQGAYSRTPHMSRPIEGGYSVAGNRMDVPAMVVASRDPVSAQADPHTHSFTPLPQETVSGTIELVRTDGTDDCELCEACEDCRAVHVLLRTRSGRVEVHLAPAWYLARLEFAPAVGDVVRITGSKARVAKGRGLAAHEIHIGHIGIRLRDEHGLALWRRLLTDERD
jgi:hypothetical protein